MAHYPPERKQAVLSKFLPPQSLSVAEVSRQEGIHVSTLYTWRNEAKSKGIPVPGRTHTSEQWSAEAKLATVIETATFSEAQLSQYCREKGLYPEQVKSWKAEALLGFASRTELDKEAKRQARDDRRTVKQLKQELARKEKALAETAALLVLRKKLNALWPGDEEE